MMAKLLRLTEGEWRQARALAEVQLTALFRGSWVVRGGRRVLHSGFHAQLWDSLLWGALIPLVSVAFLVETARAFLWMAMGFLFSVLLAAQELGTILLEHRDSDVVFHRPITSGALLGARVLQIAVSALLIALGLFVPPAMALIVVSGWNPLPGVLFLLGGLAEAAFATLAVLTLYAAMARILHVERVKRVALVFNLLASFVVVPSYQAGALWTLAGEETERVRLDAWMYFVPPAWFSGPVDILFWGLKPTLVLQALLGLPRCRSWLSQLPASSGRRTSNVSSGVSSTVGSGSAGLEGNTSRSREGFSSCGAERRAPDSSSWGARSAWPLFLRGVPFG